MNPLRDANRVLAHDYTLELPPARPTVERTRATWRDVAEALAGFVVLALFAVGGWLWMAIAAAAEVTP